MIRRASVVGLVFVAGACGLRAQTSQATGYADVPQPLANLQDERINEISGIVPSHRNPGCYYVHNDSGDRPRVFLIDREGRTRLTIRLKGARAIDYEDVALAPGEEPGSFDVCVADIGDNDERRPSVTIYRFPEVELKEREGATIDVQPVAVQVRYPDGPANAEGFLVHPRTGDGYVFTKRLDGGSVVYKLAAPWAARQVTVLTKLLTLRLPPAPPPLRVVTAADIAPDGRRVAVRCFVGGWEWRLPSGIAKGDFERVFQTTPVQLPLAPERQGEALCYSADGKAVLTVGEGRLPTLYELPIK